VEWKPSVSTVGCFDPNPEGAALEIKSTTESSIFWYITTACYLVSLYFGPEDGSDLLLRNIGVISQEIRVRNSLHCYSYSNPPGITQARKL
jgi:hypothetical protein